MNLEFPNILLDSLENGHMIIDDNFIVTYWNRWLTINTQISADDILGKSLEEFYPDINYRVLKRKITTALQLKTPTFYDQSSSTKFISINRNKVTTSSLTLMQQQVTISPYIPEKNQVMISIYDISELHETRLLLQNEVEKVSALNIKLEEEKEHAEFANKSKSRFLANMSHEIRTPMNGILGFVDILEKSEMDEERKNKFAHIRSSSQLLLSIVNDILDISKLESGKLTIENLPTDTKSLFESIISTYQNICYDKKILFEHQIDKSLPSAILTDIVRVKQVIFNLLSNAVKFTSENGKVSLNISYDKHNDSLLCDICDTGIGIAPENIDKIFNAFEQEDISTTRKYGGTGLGLAISSNIVALMDGEITVESTLNEGSCFSFSIKAPECDINDSITKEQPSNENTPKTLDLKVLIVEDNLTNQKLLGFYLEDLNIKYDIASDGLEAVEHFKSNDYDIILMDENMPNMNGIEATKIIRSLEKQDGLEPIKIIAVTANALSGDREKFINAGMDDYISKPYSDQDIERILNKYSS